MMRVSMALGSETVRPPGFEVVYDQYFDFAWRNLRRLGVPPAQLDDAVQDTFVVVHRRLAEFEGRLHAGPEDPTEIRMTSRNRRMSPPPPS